MFIARLLWSSLYGSLDSSWSPWFGGELDGGPVVFVVMDQSLCRVIEFVEGGEVSVLASVLDKKAFQPSSRNNNTSFSTDLPSSSGRQFTFKTGRLELVAAAGIFNFCLL